MKTIKTLLAIILIMALTACLFGCEFLGNLFSKKFDTPNVRVIGNTVVWDEIEGAEEYDIYCNDELVTTTKDPYYISRDNDKNLAVQVVAKNDKPKRNSDLSDKVILYKQTNFTEEETLTINLNSGKYEVLPKINKVVISGSSDSAHILILDRTNDLFIELNNVTMTAPSGKSCIATQGDIFDSTAKRFSVTIQVNGTNMLTGGNCTTVPERPATNKEITGKKGGNGGSGIILPLVSFTGDGTLTLNGANGGRGGTGSDSSGMSTSRFGAGGTGGDGGSGIKSTNIVVSMLPNGILKAYGGKCGKGGSPGSNGSILSGPLYTSTWENYYGKNGEDGQSLCGEIAVYSGVYLNQ